MRITLTEQLQQIIAEENRIKEEHLIEFWKSNEMPKKLFATNRIGTIREIEVLGSDIDYQKDCIRLFSPYYDESKRPTKILVSEYLEYVEKIKTAEQIIYVRYKDSGTGCYKYSDLLKEPRLAFNESDLKEESERLKELFAPKENHTACGYCGKQTPNDKLISSTIIGRGRKEVYNSWKGRWESKACVTHEPMKFCSGDCAGSEQMSREG